MLHVLAIDGTEWDIDEVLLMAAAGVFFSRAFFSTCYCLVNGRVPPDGIEPLVDYLLQQLLPLPADELDFAADDAGDELGLVAK